jgi:hypothetical protein
MCNSAFAWLHPSDPVGAIPRVVTVGSNNSVKFSSLLYFRIGFSPCTLTVLHLSLRTGPFLPRLVR